MHLRGDAKYVSQPGRKYSKRRRCERDGSSWQGYASTRPTAIDDSWWAGRTYHGTAISHFKAISCAALEPIEQGQAAPQTSTSISQAKGHRRRPAPSTI